MKGYPREIVKRHSTKLKSIHVMALAGLTIFLLCGDLQKHKLTHNTTQSTFPSGENTIWHHTYLDYNANATTVSNADKMKLVVWAKSKAKSLGH